MAAAWLLSQWHDVTIYERDRRIGGHSNTVMVENPGGSIPVDTGFIVYNEATYPNLTALLRHLGVVTRATDMSLAVSLDDGGFEYSGGSLAGLLAQRRNLGRLRFWSMMSDLVRFYREAPRDLPRLADDTTLRDYLDARGYGLPFRRDHLLPMAAAIWSASADDILAYPAASFIRFQESHGLLRLRGRPVWRTVAGGSRSYVARLTAAYWDRIRIGAPVVSIARTGGGVQIRDAGGNSASFDHVVLATHADQALAALDDPTDAERRLLGAFRYTRNRAVLHSDPALMPKRRAVWSSWNHMGGADGDPPMVSYWMNALQGLPRDRDVFVTLNPRREPSECLHEEIYEHPVFDAAALEAQRQLWSLQGAQRTWFCGAYFGAGFHEDGLQSGLAVAEALGAPRRPWTVPDESGRIFMGEASPATTRKRAAA